MTPDPLTGLSAREREILDILYRLGHATAEAVKAEMDSPPSNATVRSTLRVLEEKGRIEHEKDGVRFVYAPVATAKEIRVPALRHLVETFFGGSTVGAVAALLGGEEAVDQETRTRMAELIERLEEEGR